MENVGATLVVRSTAGNDMVLMKSALFTSFLPPPPHIIE